MMFVFFPSSFPDLLSDTPSSQVRHHPRVAHRCFRSARDQRPSSTFLSSFPPLRSLSSRLQLGVIPGAGGTQRLTHAIGKSRAMELVLTGRNFSAQEASDWGLVSRIVDPKTGTVVDEAVKVAGKIASKGRIAVQAAKEGVNSGALAFFPLFLPRSSEYLHVAAYELSLSQGLHLERRLFHQLFATVRPSCFSLPPSPFTDPSLSTERPENRHEGVCGEGEAPVDALVGANARRAETKKRSCINQRSRLDST